MQPYKFHDAKLAEMAAAAASVNAVMMADGDDDASATEKVEARDHFDNPVVFLLVISVFVAGVFCVGRAVGNRFNQPGVTAFFSG